MSHKTCGECCHLEKTEHFGFQCKHCNGAVSISRTACKHFSKHYGICPECGSYLFSYEHTEDNDWQLCTCERCGCSGTPDEFLYNSVFARITTSPEVLANKFVFCAEYKTIRPMYLEGKGGIVVAEVWKSTIIPDDTFSSEAEAIAATVVKLKEVKK